jgi:hypothetical protein
LVEWTEHGGMISHGRSDATLKPRAPENRQPCPDDLDSARAGRLRANNAAMRAAQLGPKTCAQETGLRNAGPKRAREIARSF